MHNWEWRPRLDPRTTWIEVDCEAIAVGPRSRDLHLLNSTGLVLLRLLDGSAPIREIAEDVNTVFGVPTPDALDQLVDFASHLAAGGLLEDPGGEDDVAMALGSSPGTNDKATAPAASPYLTAPPDP